MAPVATEKAGAAVGDQGAKKQAEASQLANPFYSPLYSSQPGEDEDKSYKYAKYKVNAPGFEHRYTHEHPFSPRSQR
jgi:hypothetical protein